MCSINFNWIFIEGVAERVMLCQSCPQKFGTPWSLLQHAQNVHALQIYLENGDYGPGIMSTHITTKTNQLPTQALFSAQSMAQMTQLIALQVQNNLQLQQNQPSANSKTFPSVQIPTTQPYSYSPQSCTSTAGRSLNQNNEGTMLSRRTEVYDTHQTLPLITSLQNDQPVGVVPQELARTTHTSPSTVAELQRDRQTTVGVPLSIDVAKTCHPELEDMQSGPTPKVREVSQTRLTSVIEPSPWTIVASSLRGQAHSGPHTGPLSGPPVQCTPSSGLPTYTTSQIAHLPTSTFSPALKNSTQILQSKTTESFGVVGSSVLQQLAGSKPNSSAAESNSQSAVVTVSTPGVGVPQFSPGVSQMSHQAQPSVMAAPAAALEPSIISPQHLAVSNSVANVTYTLPGIQSFKLSPNLAVPLLTAAQQSVGVPQVTPTEKPASRLGTLHTNPTLIPPMTLLAAPIQTKEAAVIPQKLLPQMQEAVVSQPHQLIVTTPTQKAAPLLQQPPFLASFSQKPVTGSIAIIKPTEVRPRLLETSAKRTDNKASAHVPTSQSTVNAEPSRNPTKTAPLRTKAKSSVTIIKGCCEDCSCLHSGSSRTANSGNAGSVDPVSKGPMIGLCCQESLPLVESLNSGDCCSSGQTKTLPKPPKASCCSKMTEEVDKVSEAVCSDLVPEIDPSDPAIICTDVGVQADRCCREATARSSNRPARNKSVSGEGKGGEDGDDRCCDNQDCGVTIMPGTHEGLKKCCNSVVPKKRKRHMETKHLLHRSKKRGSDATFTHTTSEGTIYIDFEPTTEIPTGSSASGVTLSANESTGTITVNTNPTTTSQARMSSVVSQTQSSVTLSIPVSYTMRGSCPFQSCNGPLKIPVQQARDHAKCCRMEGCPVAREFFGSGKDRSKSGKSTHKVQAHKGQVDGKNTSGKTSDAERICESVACNSKAENEALQSQHFEDNSQFLETKEDVKNNIGCELQGGGDGQEDSMLAAPGGLRMKKRRYPTSRPFKCDQCDNAFNQRIHLRKHQSKHTGMACHS